MFVYNHGRVLSRKELERFKAEVEADQKKWEKANPRIQIAPRILYICDRRACEVCSENCKLTPHIEHATFFQKHGEWFIEQEEDNT